MLNNVRSFYLPYSCNGDDGLLSHASKLVWPDWEQLNAFLAQSNHRRNSPAHGYLARDRDSSYHRSVAQTISLRPSRIACAREHI